MIPFGSGLIRSGYIYPPELFYGCGEEVVSALIRRADEDESSRRLLLSALGMAGVKSDSAVDQFRSWREDPSERDLTPYCLEGGWSLNSEGGKVNHVRHRCLEIEKADQVGGPVKIMVPTDTSCPNCERSLVHSLRVRSHPSAVVVFAVYRRGASHSTL